MKPVKEEEKTELKYTNYLVLMGHIKEGHNTYPLHPGVLQHLAGTESVFGIPDKKFGY